MDERRLLTVEEETTLLPFLLLRVKDKSRNTVKGLLSRRQVLVDGRVVTRFDAPLAPGQRVELLPQVLRRGGGAPLPGALPGPGSDRGGQARRAFVHGKREGAHPYRLPYGL